MNFLCVVFCSLFFASLASFSQKETSQTVFFDTDNYNLSVNEKNKLLSFISKIDSLPINRVTIYGFCDDRGTEIYNLKLSQNRANTIKKLLNNFNFPDSLIKIVHGKGEIALTDIKEKDIKTARSLNRKVEINVELEDTIYLNKYIKRFYKKNKTVLLTKNLLDDNVKIGDKIRLENIFFITNYAFVTPNSKRNLEKIAAILVERSDINFIVLGHACCSKNTREAINRKTQKRNLSEDRAKYVFNYLAKNGVRKDRMKYVGLGRQFPLGGDPKYDRRVELLITSVKKKK